MGVGTAIVDDHAAGFRAEIARAAGAGTNELLRWFDNAPDADTAFIRGAWDFSTHIAHPLLGHITAPWGKVALEIGFGGGRLTAAAARMFGRVIGVDIHDHAAEVDAELHKRGITNALLLQADGTSLPVPDASVDVVYSFIVLQHVQRAEVVRTYLRETARVLRPGGFAVLHAGRWCARSKDHTERWRLWADALEERVKLPLGFLEIPARVNETNLRIAGWWYRREAEAAGLRVMRLMPSRRMVPDGYHRWGGQIGLIAMKPDP